MAVVETSISINQPVEKVFEYLTDVAKQKDLNPMINEVVMEGTLAVGSRYKIKMTVAGRAFELVNEIVATGAEQDLRDQDAGQSPRFAGDEYVHAREGRQRHEAAHRDGCGGHAGDRRHGCAAAQGRAGYHAGQHEEVDGWLGNIDF